MSEEYTLNWYTFSEHLQSMFKDLYQEREYADVTLVCDDQTQFKAHKIVLSACSPVLKKTIDNDPSQKPQISLKGVESNEIESILQFMYLGEGRFYYERMDKFLKVSKDLEVKEICKGMEEDDATEKTVMDCKKKENYEDYKPQHTSGKKIREKRHRNQLASLDNSIHKCPVCEKVFKQRGGMRSHYKSKHEGLKYSCPHCDSELTTRAYLRTHIESVHEGIKFACNQCDHQASRQSTLQNHIKTVHEGLKYPCNQCDLQFTDYSSRYKHIQSKHEGIVYPCEQCDRKFTTPGDRKKHTQSVHDGIKYSCNQCDYQATDKYYMKTHIKSVHEGIRYPCNQCNYQATTQSDCKRHIQSVHEGIKKKEMVKVEQKQVENNI